MDKPQQKITVKINGKIRSIPIDDENKRQERQKEKQKEEKKKHVEEVAATKEAKDGDSFEWILPELEESVQKEKERETIPFPPKPKKSRPNSFRPWKKKGPIQAVFFIVLFAVIIGSSIGMFMLYIVTEKAEQAAEQVTGEEQKRETGTTETGEMSLPAFTTYVVQSGVYSTKESAEHEAQSIKSLGIPVAIVETDGQYYLFCGIADTLDNAKTIGSQLGNSGIDIYAKEMEFGGTIKENVNAAEQQLLQLIPNIFESVSSISSNIALSNDIPKELIDTVNTQKDQVKNIGEMKDDQIIQLKKEVEGAFTLIDEYVNDQRDPSGAKLQNQLLKLLALYETL